MQKSDPMNQIVRLLMIFLFFNVLPDTLYSQNKKFKIVIDAGHGGRDGGCRGRILKEKDLNLTVALKVGRLIESNHPDVQVIYTRKTDVFVELNKRAEIANQHRADLFVSIHADAIPRSKNTASAYGAGTFTLGTAKTEENLEVAKRENAVILLEDNYQKSYEGFDPNSAESYIMFETLQGIHQAQSIQFASLIQEQFRTTAQRRDRQVRQAPYLVLKETGMPAVLVEVGFLSNVQEEKFLATAEGKDKISKAIYRGFVNYKDAFDRHNQNVPKGIVRPTTNVSQERPNNRQSETKSNSTADKKTAASTPSKSTASSSSKNAPSTNKAAATTPKASTSGKVVYKVQFLSHHQKLKKGAPQLKGLWPVTIYYERGSYRYAYGETTDFNEAIRLQKKVRAKFKDAFVVRFRNGERLTK